jgi:hypothetical protein
LAGAPADDYPNPNSNAQTQRIDDQIAQARVAPRNPDLTQFNDDCVRNESEKLPHIARCVAERESQPCRHKQRKVL